MNGIGSVGEAVKEVVKEAAWYLRLTRIFTGKAVKAMLTYRFLFVINCISQALDYAVAFLLMWVMISAFDSLNGWNACEVMLLYAFSLFAYGIAGTFFFNIMNHLPGQIWRGGFDDVLIKPVKVLPYLLSSSFICNYIAHITLSILVMGFCFHALEMPVTLWLLLKILRILFSGSLIYGGFFLIVSGSAFLVTRTDALFHIMFFFREVSYYPLSVFPKVIQIIATVLVPYGFINFYPLRELLGKEEAGGLGDLAGWSPVVALVFFAAACLFFCRSARQYKSSGS